MAILLRFGKGIRTHWKKSTFAACCLTYGALHLKEKYEISCLMRTYCEEAAKYGDVCIPVSLNTRTITVILNPAANKRSSNEMFEKYCEPILHLAGIHIDIIKTSSEGHARKIVEEMTTVPDAILVAGGDGTLAEAVTGLLRRSNNDACPIGVLPLGRNSIIGTTFFPGSTDGGVDGAKGLASAALAIVKGNVTTRDVMKVEVLSEDENTSKPVYAVGSLQWGAFRDTMARRDKYWYYGPMKEYASYIFNGYKDSLSWNCNAKVIYSEPCQGCKHCKLPSNVEPQKKQWWKYFIPSMQKTQHPILIDYNKVINENCSVNHTKEINTTELFLTTENYKNKDVLNKDSIPKLLIALGPNNISYADFVLEGWNRIKGNDMSSAEYLQARTIEIIPDISSAKNEVMFAIDSEEYEVKPVRITLIPNAFKMFCL